MLQASRRFVICAVLAGRVPGYFRLSQAKRRQYVKQMQFGLILLRERQAVVERHLCMVRKVVGHEHALQSYFVTWLIYPVAFVAVHDEYWTGRAPANGFGGGTKQRRSMGSSSRTHHNQINAVVSSKLRDCRSRIVASFNHALPVDHRQFCGSQILKERLFKRFLDFALHEFNGIARWFAVIGD